MTDVVHLLWTGGWDSTFRLCDLALVRGVTVQPHYIIDPGRSSLAQELRTMHKIRGMVNDRGEQYAQRLLPTVFAEFGAVAPSARLTRQYKSLHSVERLGTQYEWLARYAVQKGLSGRLEFGAELGSNVSERLRDHLKEIDDYVDGAGPAYRTPEDEAAGDMQLFSHFAFPLILTTKLQMEACAREHGFDDIIEATWFCLNPQGFDTVCSRCVPCRIAMDTGMGRRVPASARLRALPIKVLAPLRPRKRVRDAVSVIARCMPSHRAR